MSFDEVDCLEAASSKSWSVTPQEGRLAGITPTDQGYLVKVVATYAFPLSIPFWNSKTINVSSTAQMVVAQ